MNVSATSSGKSLTFSIGEYQSRLGRLMAVLRENDTQGLILRSPENICYLTGYETATFNLYHALLITEDDIVLIVRDFDEASAQEYSWITHTVPFGDHQNPVEVLSSTISALGLQDQRLAIEKRGWFFSILEYEEMQSMLDGVKFVDLSRQLDLLRLRKSPEELEAIRKSAQVAEKAVMAGIDYIEPGRTENEVAARIYRVLLENGSEYTSLPPFVLAGERTSLPHQTWRGQTIQPGDPVFIETSANFCRYSAALIRTISLGKPSKRLHEFSSAVLSGLEAAISTIAPGVSAAAVDQACRHEIQTAGFGQYFRNRTGYSIGINFPPGWGEGHILNLRHAETTLLDENMVFHLVPICLDYRNLGVGFSATVRVSENGCEALTTLPRELIIK